MQHYLLLSQLNDSSISWSREIIHQQEITADMFFAAPVSNSSVSIPELKVSMKIKQVREHRLETLVKHSQVIIL